MLPSYEKIMFCKAFSNYTMHTTCGRLRKTSKDMFFSDIQCSCLPHCKYNHHWYIQIWTNNTSPSPPYVHLGLSKQVTSVFLFTHLPTTKQIITNPNQRQSKPVTDKIYAIYRYGYGQQGCSKTFHYAGLKRCKQCGLCVG